MCNTVATAGHVESLPNLRAGEGDFKPFILPANRNNMQKISDKPWQYLSIYAMQWFINDKSSIFEKCTVSGVLTCTIPTTDSGTFVSKIILNPYVWEDGLKTAPMFTTPIIPAIRYASGDIGIKLDVVQIKKDTLLAVLLKTIGEAGLAIGVAALGTVTGGAAVAAAAAAGVAMAGEATNVLRDAKREPKQYFGGEVGGGIESSNMKIGHSYLLLHRGSALDADHIKIVEQPSCDVFYNDSPLRDGIWVLLKISVLNEYSGTPRPWRDAKDNFYQEIRKYMMEWQLTLKQQADVKAFLTGDGQKKYDYFHEVIKVDPVLTEIDQDAQIKEIDEVYKSAMIAVKNGKPELFLEAVAQAAQALRSGSSTNNVSPSASTSALVTAVASIENSNHRRSVSEEISANLMALVTNH